MHGDAMYVCKYLTHVSRLTPAPSFLAFHACHVNLAPVHITYMRIVSSARNSRAALGPFRPVPTLAETGLTASRSNGDAAI